MTWWNNPKFNSYADMAEVWQTCRSPAKGKPIAVNIRMFKNDDDSLRLTHRGTTFATVTPDNVVTLGSIDTFPMGSYKFLPILINNIGIGRYRVEHTLNLGRGSNFDWVHMRRKAPEFFKGIQFHLLTGVCIHRKADLPDRIKPEAALEWKRAVRAYKNGWKLRARLGLINELKVHSYGMHNTSTKELARIIKDQDFSEEAMSVVIVCARDIDYANAFDVAITKLRTPLRQEFGVYAE